MADVNETLAGISAFIREAAQAQYEAWMNDPNDAPDGRHWSSFLAKLADRIDAAAVGKQSLPTETVTKCNGVGNAAAMREALETLLIHFMCDVTLLNDRFTPLFAIINHALAAPPRNCDRPEIKTLADAIAAASKEIRKPQELHDAAYSPDMFVAAWLLAEGRRRKEKE